MHDFFIDLDDTLITELTAPACELFMERRLMAVLRDQAVALGGLERGAVERVLADLDHATPWWRWGDFISRVNLDESAFWDAADEFMASRSTPCVRNVTAVLTDLRNQGHRLWITSNNPSDGIAHKLRLAGVDAADQAELFAGFIGTDAAHAMKWDAAFWRRALELAETSGDRVIVVGDNPRDDMVVPHGVGIRRGFLVPAHANAAEPLPPLKHGWTPVPSIDCIPAALRETKHQPALSA